MGQEKRCNIQNFFIFVPMELEKDREEMERNSTFTISGKQEFKVDP